MFTVHISVQQTNIHEDNVSGGLLNFLICYTALLMYRLLEVKLDRNGTHFTTRQIIETIKNMNVVDCEGAFYKACYTGSDVLDAFEQLYNLKLNRKHYQPKDLNKISKKI